MQNIKELDYVLIYSTYESPFLWHLLKISYKDWLALNVDFSEIKDGTTTIDRISCFVRDKNYDFVIKSPWEESTREEFINLQLKHKCMVLFWDNWF